MTAKKTVEFSVVRDTFITEGMGEEGYTLGRIYRDNLFLGHTLEDEDRHLESAGKGAKVYGKTAIPCGRYRLTITMSKRFGKLMLQLLNVGTHEGIRIHAANRAKQLEGCIAVGECRTVDGVQSCAPVVNRIFRMVKEAEALGQECWITVKRKEE